MTYRATHQEVLAAWRAGGQSSRSVANALGCSIATAQRLVNAALRYQARTRVQASAVAAAPRPAVQLVPPPTELTPHLALRAVRAHGGNLTAAAAELRVNRDALRVRVAEALRIPTSALTQNILGRLAPVVDRPRETAAGWRSDAECLQVDPELFFPISEKPGPQVDAAKAVCMGCPVRPECLDWALQTRQEHGIWGGTTSDERRSLRRRRAVTARATSKNETTTEEVA